jgi:hypothetical protein
VAPSATSVGGPTKVPPELFVANSCAPEGTSAVGVSAGGVRGIEVVGTRDAGAASARGTDDAGVG